MATLLSEALAAVRGLKWQNFELLVAEGFRVQGFSVVEVAADRQDGPDLVLVKGERKFCVHCRDWQDPAVGISSVKDLYGVMVGRDATGGFIVTAGDVAEDAASLAHERNIQFVKGPKLLALIDKARETITTGMPAHAGFGIRATSDGGY